MTMQRLAFRYTRNIMLPLTAAMLLSLSVNAQAQSTEQRVQRLERFLDSSTLMDMARQGDQLQNEVKRLTGELEEAQREIAELRSQQRSLFEDVDMRLQDIEQGRSGGSESTPEDSSLSSTTGPAVIPTTPGLDADLAAPGEQEDSQALPELAEGDGAEPAESHARTSTEDQAEAAYRQAFELLREGRYGAAGDGFRQVMEDHPDTRYADNAKYWLGETYYVIREFDAAMEQFQAVMNDPDNIKQPDAMLKAGYIQYERGNLNEARQTLEKIKDDFPDTTVSTLAENRLQRINDQGR